MENLDVFVLRTLHSWRAAGRRALMATVVRTWGSSPRPVGSIMALCEDGAVVGSVSGGCIEDDLIDRYTRAYVHLATANPTATAAAASTETTANPPGADHSIPSGPPAFVKYGITADEAHRFGLPCGGTLELLLEYDPDPCGLAELLALLQSGHLVQRTVRLSDGTATLSMIPAPQAMTIDVHQLTNTFGPEYRMLIIGAGQLTEYLATMALFSGFAVTVCDPREEYRASWHVPGATVVSEMPDDVVQAFKPDHRTCVVALTHDPKLDDLALLEALQTDAFYVGGIGSRRNNEARRARMVEHFDQTAESLARLRGPIGIYIGSKTPPEIAVSVMAEILAVKNGVTLPRDMAVAEAKNEREQQHSDLGTPVCGVR
ncbi:XdhC family protein [Acidovorax radicis]|jgi:xanthine dehydrogenase accessory factor|uniref:XdhC family protein n=1 Tax=Acidovorax radicis TaxID=758826 RepID=UPI001CF839DA|nr:XdhC family protein [Acidovorax radicis]UCU98167.1 XdhC family protein [Acidovorax radicis]